jgi:hypothetical protein
MKKRDKSFLHEGTEVVTDDLRIAIVDRHTSDSRVAIRYHYPPWPFPEWDFKSRCQLTRVPIQYEEAPF